MKQVFTLTAIASALLLTGCGSDSSLPPIENELREMTLGFNVLVDESDMTAPNGIQMAGVETLQKLNAADFANRKGYVIMINGEPRYDLPGAEPDGTFTIDNGTELTLEVRDGYQITVFHPDLPNQLKAAFSESYSLYGEHTLSSEDVGSIKIDLDNTAFSFVTLVDSEVINNAELNEADFVNSEVNPQEGVRYGFVNGDEYQLMINSQFGMKTYVREAEVGKHYHWTIDETTGGFNPGFEWDEGDMGETIIPFKSQNLNLLVGINGNIQGTVASDGLAQIFKQEEPGTSIAALKVNIAVTEHSNTEAGADWGYTNIYLVDDAGTNYCATIEDNQVRLQQAWGCGHNEETLVGTWDSYSDFRLDPTYNHLVLREEADFGTKSNIFHRMNPATKGQVVDITFDTEVTDPVGPVSIVKATRTTSGVESDGTDFSYTGTKHSSVGLALDGDYTVGDFNLSLDVISSAQDVHVNLYTMVDGAKTILTWFPATETWADFQATNSGAMLRNDYFEFPLGTASIVFRSGSTGADAYDFEINNFDATVIK